MPSPKRGPFGPCRTCNGEIPPHFDGRAKYCSDDCRRITQREQTNKWKADNKDAVLAYKRRTHHKYYNKEKHDEWCRANKHRCRGYKKKWAKANPGLVNEKTRRRQAAQINATPSWLSEKHIEEMVKIYAKAAESSKQVDHIIPLQGKTVCGLHVPWNLQLLTATENREKSNKL